jgi:hypothetical protein
MSWDDVHLPDEAHGSHMTTPREPEPTNDALGDGPLTFGDPSRPIGSDAGIDLDLDGESVDAFFAHWKQSVSDPPRIDVTLAKLLDQGMHRQSTAAPLALEPEPKVVTATDDEFIAVANVIDLDEARSRRGRTRRVVVRSAVVGMASLTVSSGLAAAGVLPSPVQRAVSSAADVVGIHIEQPARPVLGEVVVDTTEPADARVIPSRPQRGGSEASVATAPPAHSDDGANPDGHSGEAGGSGGPKPTTAPKTTRPEREAPTTTSPSDGKRQCPAGEVPTNSEDEPDGCRPCRTHDPETGEVIPNWKLAHKCRPCPSERSRSDAPDNADEQRPRKRARASEPDERGDSDDRRGDHKRRRVRDRARSRTSDAAEDDQREESDRRQGSISARSTARPVHHCAPRDRNRNEAEAEAEPKSRT